MFGGTDNATDVLFPQRPNPPLPSRVELSELIGTYYDAGYGDFTLRVEPHPSKSNEKILVADRYDMSWQYSLKMHHVSGEYWVVFVDARETSGYGELFVAGEFKLGADGKIRGLEIDWASPMDDMKDGKVLFKKIEEQGLIGL